MASDIEICNLALSNLGISKEIASSTEDSAEAETCNRFFVDVRDELLRDFPWTFATKFVALGLVEEDPNDEWGFSYRYPSDCIKVRRILSGIRNDTPATKTKMKIIADDDGLLILTDYEDAEIEYTFRAEDPMRYPSDFKKAFALKLAIEIAPRLIAGDPYSIGPKLTQKFLYEIQKAQASSISEEVLDEFPDAEMITARN